MTLRPYSGKLALSIDSHLKYMVVVGMIGIVFYLLSEIRHAGLVVMQELRRASRHYTLSQAFSGHM